MSKKLFTYSCSRSLCSCAIARRIPQQSYIDKAPAAPTGTLEKMIVANGVVTMDVDLRRLNGNVSASDQSRLDTLRFDVAPDSFFTVLVFNNLLRTPEFGSQMTLTPQTRWGLPECLRTR